MTSAHPLSDPDWGELDDGPGQATDDPSGFVNKSSSEWLMGLTHSPFTSSPRLGGTWSGLDRGGVSSRIDDSSCMTSIHPLSAPDWCELDCLYDGRATYDPSGFVYKSSSAG